MSKFRLSLVFPSSSLSWTTLSIVIVVVVVRLKDLLPLFFLIPVNVWVQFISIFPDRELLVVINRDVNLLGTDWFIVGVVELSDIWMLQSLLSCESFARVKLHQILEQIDGVVAGSGEDVSNSPGLGGRQWIQHRLSQWTVNGVNVLGWWSPSEFHDSIQLVECGCTWENRFSKQQLCQNAAQTPHIYAFSVFVRAEQDFRSSVPSGGDIVG